VLSMTLRFVPRFVAQIKVVSETRRCAGCDASEGNLFQRARSGLTVLSITITWSLENAIETADSMKSRGYGLPGRAAFSIYRFDSRDKYALLWLLFCGMYLISGWTTGGLYFRYYPTMKSVASGAFPASFMLVYLALCLTPIFLNAREGRKWTRLQSAA